MPDEAIVKLASLFGSNGGLTILRGYTHFETLDIYRKLPLGSTLLALVLAPYLIIRTLFRCSRQSRRWPWLGFERYMAVPLSEIRSEYNIKVAHARSNA